MMQLPRNINYYKIQAPELGSGLNIEKAIVFEVFVLFLDFFLIKQICLAYVCELSCFNTFVSTTVMVICHAVGRVTIKMVQFSRALNKYIFVMQCIVHNNIHFCL